ncbi:glycosyltransferase [Knoellia flava]|uniref:Glycosyltransferase n=2 Tax=Knoellia flava TaxID=913969 RepID=A0A8H9FUR3_9MICO|nr:glycosyltransferase [Knoellia flava]GGB84420.1 hypothetical protein GCM10011314_25080 [Knoellia flava]
MAVDVSFVTSGHDVADARLHRLVAAARRHGLTVEVLGLGDPADAPEAEVVHAAPRGSFARRAALAWSYAVRARGRVLLALDPDSLLACLAVGRARGRKVVADVHEDYPALLRDRPWARGWRGRVARGLAESATSAARRADLVVVADEHVPPKVHPRRLVVTNLPDLQMLPEPAAPDATPRALYVGDVRGSRGLWTMLDALRGAPGWHLDIVGPVAASDEAEVERRLDEGDLRSRVTLWGRRPPQEAWRRACGAWCGLVLLDRTPAFVDALPSKLHEYLGSGLAVIATDLPRQAALVRASGAGVVVPSEGAADAVADQLRAWQVEGSDLPARRAAARAWREGVLSAAPYDVFAARLEALARA